MREYERIYEYELMEFYPNEKKHYKKNHSIRLSDSLYFRLTEKAKEHGQDTSNFIRSLLLDGVNRESVYEGMEIVSSLLKDANEQSVKLLDRTLEQIALSLKIQHGVLETMFIRLMKDEYRDPESMFNSLVKNETDEFYSRKMRRYE